MKRKILELIIIILFYCLSVTLGRVIELGGIKPNMLIVLPILFGYLNGSNEGMFVGFFSGLIYDIFISKKTPIDDIINIEILVNGKIFSIMI